MEVIPLQKSKADFEVSNLFLIGFMGTGKSTVGKILARKLGWKFIDSDLKIQNKAKHKIADIIDQHGIRYFRKLESKIIADICKSHQQVVALGGGSVLNSVNRKRLEASGIMIQLEAKTRTIYSRLIGDQDRPLIRANTHKKQREKIQKLYRKRKKYYQASKSVKIITDHMKPDEVATEVQRYMGHRK